MVTLTLKIEDEKVGFFKDLIENFSFVEVQSENDGDSDEQVRENIRQGIEEMKLVERGELKSTPFCEFLKELDEV